MAGAGFLANLFSSAGNRGVVQQPQQAVQGMQNGQQQQGAVQPSAGPGGNNNPANAVSPAAAPGQQNAQAQKDAQGPQNADKVAEQGLDFNKIWETPDPSKQVADPGKFNRPKLDAAKLRDGVGKMSFTQGMDQAKVAKALGGDVQSFMEIMEQVSRNTFNTSFQANEAYNGQMLDSYDGTVNARIPREIGRRETQSLVQESFKGMDNPGIAPMLRDITSKFQAAYPDASPQQIAEAAKKYLLDAAKTITGQSESGENTAVNGNQQARQNGAITDFSGFETNGTMQ